VDIRIIDIRGVSNLFLYYFLKAERKKNQELLFTVNKVNHSIEYLNKSLKGKHYQGIKVCLDDVQENLKNAAPVFSESSVKNSLLKGDIDKKVRNVVFHEGQIISSAVFLEENELLLVCEKNTKTLHLFKMENENLQPVASYPCLVGVNQKDKKFQGDFATPEGVYFFTRFIPGSRLPEQYGYGAFVMNYPNFTDEKDGREGGGIWLHGHSEGKKLEEINFTRGCIVISNGDMEKISKFIKLEITPVITLDKIKFNSVSQQEQIRGELITFLSDWEKSWEIMDTEKYLSFYSPDFISARGMDYKSFCRHKMRVNSNKKYIKLKIETKSVLMAPHSGGKEALVRFNQWYISDNYKDYAEKIFFLRKGKEGWRIIGETYI
jgi:murein L,D-transpeptidase YafK